MDARSEEVEVEHVPVVETVSERRQPWEEGDVLIVPMYEEQLVVTKRLERLIVDDDNDTGLVHTALK